MYSIVNKVQFGRTEDLHIISKDIKSKFLGLEAFLFYGQLLVLFSTYKHNYSG